MKNIILIILLGLILPLEVVKSFHSNGMPEVVATYKNTSKLELLKVTNYYSDGFKKYEYFYSNGELKRHQAYDRKGREISPKTLSRQEEHLYLDLKEKAHDELKTYTLLWKDKIAKNNINYNESDTISTCLIKQNNNCLHAAILYAEVGDVTTSPIERINDNENSKISRKALSTSIKWQSLIHGEQKIEFYVEQLVLNK